MDKVSLIYVVLSGRADEIEKKELKEWVNASQRNREEFTDVRLLWETGQAIGYSSPHHFYDGLHCIHARMGSKRRSKEHEKIRSRYLMFAVPILCMVVYCVGRYVQSTSSPRNCYTFQHDSVGDMLSVLEKDYRIRVEVDHKEVLTCSFTGTFYHESARDIIQAVSNSLELQLEASDERTFRLKGTGCGV